jgi:methionine synthase II (cobalamin-independent)
MFATLAGGYPRGPSPDRTGGLRDARDAAARGEIDPATARASEDDLVRAVIAEQQAAGLEFVTDGQVRWDDPISAIARRLDGFEIGAAAPYFTTPGTYRRPRAIREPRWNGPITIEDWRFASSCTPAIVKQTLVGPYTLARLSDPGELTRERLTMALADALSHELRRLETEGCALIQIDESAASMIGDSAAEQRLFKAAHRRLTSMVKGVHLSLGLTMGSVERVPVQILFDAPYLSYLVDLVSAPQNWKLVVASPTDRGIICGIADSSSPSADDPGLTAWAGRYTASMNGRGGDRVGLSTSASLQWLSWQQARSKIDALAAVAAEVDGALGAPDAAGDPVELAREGFARGYFGNVAPPA